MAAAIMTTKTVTSHESSKSRVGAGINESEIPVLPSPTIMAAIGVRKPTKSKTPHAAAIRPITHIVSV